MMKRYSLILLIAVICSCSNSPYYEKPINVWINHNINDASSYEPAEYDVIDSIDILMNISYFNNQYYNVQTVIFRASNIAEETVYLLNESKRDSSLDKIKNLKSLNNSENINDYNQLFAESQLFVKELLNELNGINTKKQKSLELIAQLEGVNNRLEIEIQRFNKLFDRINSAPNSLENDINTGKYIIHSYRSNNEFGAKTLKKKVFILNNDLDKVVNVIEIN